MRRRIEIARVLLHEPDAAAARRARPRRRSRGAAPDLGRDRGAARRRAAPSVIVTTHQPEEAERCHRIAILDGGRWPRSARPTSCAPTSPATSCACAASAPTSIRATVTARLALAGRVVDGDVVVRGAARPRAGAAHRRAVPARPPGQPSPPAGRRWPTCSRSSPARGWRRRRDQDGRRAGGARPAPLLPPAEPHRRLGRAAADPVGGARRRLRRQLPPRRRRRRRLPAVLLSRASWC